MGVDQVLSALTLRLTWPTPCHGAQGQDGDICFTKHSFQVQRKVFYGVRSGVWTKRHLRFVTRRDVALRDTVCVGKMSLRGFHIQSVGDFIKFVTGHCPREHESAIIRIMTPARWG
jgi:hypothetical protein